MHPALRVLTYLRSQIPRILLVSGLSLLVIALQSGCAWLAADYLLSAIRGTPAPLAGEYSGRLALGLDWLTRRFLEGSSPFARLATGAAALAAGLFLIAAVRVTKLFFLETILQETNQRLRLEMFEHSLHLDLNFFRLYRPGEVSSLYVQDLDQTRYFLIDVIDRLFMQPVRLLVVFLLLYSLSPLWTFVGIGLLSSVSLTVYLVGQHIEHRSAQLMEWRGRIQGFLTEHLSTALLSRALAPRKERTEQFRQICRDLFRANRAFAVTHTGASELISVVPLLALVCLLVLAGRETLVHHSLPTENVIKMLLLFPLAAESVTSLAGLYVSMRVSAAPLRRIFRLLDLPREFVDAPGAVELTAFNQVVALRHVDFKIGDLQILTDINLQLQKGLIYVVHGPSGGGKTTLLHLIGGMYRPTRGEIEIDGRPLGTLKRASWIRQIGFVFQDPVLLNQPLRENLSWSREIADEAVLWDVLEQVGMKEKVAALPLGLDSSCGNRGELFSGGERQRLAIARALLGNPPILILDEPTSMVHELNRGRFRALIQRIARGRMLILASHDASLGDLADVTIGVANGRIAAISESGHHHGS